MTLEQHPGSVLVVDDSWYVQSLMRDALEAAGLQVHCAGDAAEAIRLHRELRPNLVLMDVVLPDMDGITASARIRDLDPHARILVVSGFVDEAARLQARQAGIAGFVTKPVSGRELVARVRAALELPIPAAWGLQTMPALVLAA